MQVREAILSRSSVRAFRPDLIERSVIADILEVAGRSPSGGNFQPWQVFVLAGAELDRFRDVIAVKLAVGEKEKPEHDVYPPKVDEPFRTRRRDAGTARYRALGSTEPTANLLDEMTRRNYRFFGAPLGLFFCIDRMLGQPQWADLGIFMQTVMLLAREKGLDTCPQAIWANWPKTIAGFLGMPANLMIVAGMSMGYRDENDTLCRTQTSRAMLSEYAHFIGFDG